MHLGGFRPLLVLFWGVESPFVLLFWPVKCSSGRVIEENFGRMEKFICAHVGEREREVNFEADDESFELVFLL